jgi:hypothetical protein
LARNIHLGISQSRKGYFNTVAVILFSQSRRAAKLVLGAFATWREIIVLVLTEAQSRKVFDVDVIGFYRKAAEVILIQLRLFYSLKAAEPQSF